MAKTTLTIDVDYDARRTDPEGLASAMDRLLETILSTPGIMAEYGDPQMGEFFVAATGDSRRASRHQAQPPSYILQIDGPLLRQQREALLDALHIKLAEGTYESLGGLIALLDEIADQGHDQYGIDCLLDDHAEKPKEPRHGQPHRPSI